MANIVSYIESEQRNFAELPFNPIDSLIMSTLAYFNFEQAGGWLPLRNQNTWEGAHLGGATHVGTNRVRLHDIVALSDWSQLTNSGWFRNSKETQPFMHALMASRRFREVEVGFYVNECSEATEKQFSATTFFFPEKTYCMNSLNNQPSEDNEAAYLAFRGTDGTYTGWKEDFNLCFKKVIPSQRAADSYLSGVASACLCPLYLGGHSKGGNLAEYAALSAEEAVYDRIVKVYNHDGPSFLEDPSPRVDTPEFQAKMHKTVPESSAFGMMLERRDDFLVVQSSAVSLFQHEPFSWQIGHDDFLYQDDLNPSAVFFDEALDAWLKSKNTEERERFIDTIYDLFVATQTDTFAEFKGNFFENAKRVIDTRSKLDPETKEFVNQTIGTLAGIVKDKTVQKINPSRWTSALFTQNNGKFVAEEERKGTCS